MRNSQQTKRATMAIMRGLLLTMLLAAAVGSQQRQQQGERKPAAAPAKASPQPTSHQPTGQQPTGQQPTGQQPTGQQPTGQTKKPEPSPAEAKALARMKADLAAASKQLRATPHAYTGTLNVSSYGDATAILPLERTFSGATDGTVQWFEMHGWNVATRGEHVAVQHGDQPWSKPQGYSPDVPISPMIFVPHLLTAKLTLPKPAEHLGRPALRIHATWSGKPIKKLLYQTTVPSTQHEQVLEALASAAGKGRKNMQLDATFLYDPASREWLSATLRFACMDGRPIPDDEQPPAAPKGLPVLPSHPLLEATWHLQRSDFQQAKRPDYDARARQLLQLDANGAPLPPKTSAGANKRPAKKKH